MALKIYMVLVAGILSTVSAHTLPAAEQIDPATCAASLIILEKSAKTSGQTEKSDVLSLMLANAYADSFDKYGNEMKPIVQRELKKYRALIDDKGNPSSLFESTMNACINVYSKKMDLKE